MLHENFRRLAFNNLGDDKKCPVCLFEITLRESKVLRCSHVVCTLCSNMINRCPLCRESTEEPTDEHTRMRMFRNLCNIRLMQNMKERAEDLIRGIDIIIVDLEKELLNENLPYNGQIIHRPPNLSLVYPNLFAVYNSHQNVPENETVGNYFSPVMQFVYNQSLKWYMFEELVSATDACTHAVIYYSWLEKQNAKRLLEKTSIPFLPPRFEPVTCGRCGKRGHRVSKHWCDEPSTGIDEQD